MGKAVLFKNFNNIFKANSPNFKTVNNLNNILLEIKSNQSELSDKQEIKLNKFESKLNRLENKVVINKLNDTSLAYKNEILNTVADLDTSVIKPFVNTINTINETDLPEILEAIQAIPKTNLEPVLSEIKTSLETDKEDILAAIENVATSYDIDSSRNFLHLSIMGTNPAEPGFVAPDESLVDKFVTSHSLLNDIDGKLDEITGAVNSIACTPVSDLEAATNQYESYLASSLRDDGVIDDNEDYVLENLFGDISGIFQSIGPNVDSLDDKQYQLFVRASALMEFQQTQNS